MYSYAPGLSNLTVNVFPGAMTPLSNVPSGSVLPAFTEVTVCEFPSVFTNVTVVLALMFSTFGVKNGASYARNLM